MSARYRLRLVRRAGLAFAIGAGLSACADDEMRYGGLLGNEPAAESTVEEPLVYECAPLPSACPSEPTEVPSYAGEIAGIIERHCGNCHLEDNLGGPWPFSHWQDVYDWSSSLRVSLEQCLMPPPESDAPLSAIDRERLQSWLACGAPNN